jgi:hypothetical protein
MWGLVLWGTMVLNIFAWTAVQGLAVGFVLLRVESLVEEGKLDDLLK